MKHKHHVGLPDCGLGQNGRKKIHRKDANATGTPKADINERNCWYNHPKRARCISPKLQPIVSRTRRPIGRCFGEFLEINRFPLHSGAQRVEAHFCSDKSRLGRKFMNHIVFVMVYRLAPNALGDC